LIHQLSWWRENPLRRDFLTAALRHGRHYTGNFEKALNSEYYFKNTKAAVGRFLSGYTKWSGKKYSFEGWVESFEYNPYTLMTK
jgi:hypothetical protein